MLSFFATAAKGTEGAVRDELRMLRFRGVQSDRGGVHFEGELVDGFRACIELRTAMRVLLQLGKFDTPSEEALYAGVRAIDWAAHVTPKTTIAVRASARSSRMTHTQYIAQKTKDAIVDKIREKAGSRPNVDLDDPDVLVSVHLAKDVATLYLDVAGGPLFKRGYRTTPFGAPVKETLAASLLFMSKWGQHPEPFLDPMCGSGTIAIEAALIAAGKAPGLVEARRFGFERWASFTEADRMHYQELVVIAEERARTKPRSEIPPVRGRDADDRAIEFARRAAAKAGVSAQFEQGDAKNLAERGPITIVTNPPYGERMTLPDQDWRKIARAITSVPDARVGLLLGHPTMLDAIPVEPRKVITVMNGDIECGFAFFDRPGPQSTRPPPLT